MVLGLRRQTAASKACKAMSVVMRGCADQPTTRGEMEEDQKTIRWIVSPTTVNDNRQILPTLMGLDVGGVGHPDPVGRIDLKLPVQGVVHEDGGAFRRIHQGGACSRSGPRYLPGQPAGPRGSLKPVPPDHADRRRACGSRRPCRSRTRPAGSARYDAHLPARGGLTVTYELLPNSLTDFRLI